MIKFDLFMLETLTNLHVGSGLTSIGLIDNLIQRDPVTQVPVIHSSGIKGAIRDEFKFSKEFNVDLLKKYFGSDHQEEKSSKEFEPGWLIFLEARLLSLPLRSSRKVFYNCTSISIINEYLDHLLDFVLLNEEMSKQLTLLKEYLKNAKFNGKDFLIFDDTEGVEIEDFESYSRCSLNEEAINLLVHFTGFDINSLALFSDEVFKEICGNYIPVIARNQLDKDGKSENLFYEEVLPRKTKLYLLIGREGDKIKDPDYKKFYEHLTSKQPIQFGGNYSVGYGFVNVSKVQIGKETAVESKAN